jgi:hypothetical protein
MIHAKKYLLLLLVTAILFHYTSHAQTHASEVDHSDHAISIMAEDYAFDAPDEIPSGWTTIEYTNEGEEPHFMIVALIPEGKTFDDVASQVTPPFNEIWHELRDGEISQEEAFEKLGTDLPEWFWAVEFMGGPGLISPGLTTKATVHLESGNYYLECYAKTEDGEFHSIEGMMRGLTVTDARSEAALPETDIDITLSNFELDIEGSLTPGTHTVAVHVAENPEEGFGHNVHVARIEPGMDVDEIVRWMNPFEITGMQTPAPTKLLGGMQMLPKGQTGYFTLDLEPGRYLFVAENTGHLGVMQEVNIE